MRARRPVRVLVLGAAAAFVLAGCGAADDEPTDAPVAGEETEDAMVEPEEEPMAESPDEEDAGSDDAGSDDAGSDDAGSDAGATDDGATVGVAETSLGEVLVDADGMTLYMFDPDMQGESTCYDDCAAAWPPLLADGEPGVGDGVDDALLGTVERSDGGTQVTYDGWPLYLWAQDSAPGDTTGQGVNEVWWVLDASGEPIRD